MTKVSKFLTQGAVAALIGVGALTAAATSADARIVCNRWGDCWHTRDVYTYPSGFGIVVHDDNWRWRHRWHHRYHWREHEGRGYWRNGVWITF